MTLEGLSLAEPMLAFGLGQRMSTPKDGLLLFGPYEDTAGRGAVRLGVIGTEAGIGLFRGWLGRLIGPIEGKLDRRGEPLLWAPAWPGFEACFGAALPPRPMAEVVLDAVAVETAIKKENRADAVRSTVKQYASRILAHLRAEDRSPDVWIVVVPDVVYRYGRPKVAPPPKAERTPSTLIRAAAARAFFEDGDLFPETFTDADTYLFTQNFHHQLKAELLRHELTLQLVRESTLRRRDLDTDRAGGRARGLQDEATVAWNFATTLYFKTDAKPWALAEVRPGVCYVGLVFKKDERPAARGEACCAAQMFLNSGDGLVFRGALGPWYSDRDGEFHLSEPAAASLMGSVVDAYTAKHGKPPSQLFIHGRSRFNAAEWAGFSAATPATTELVGVRIRPGDEMRLFRPNGSMPVMRGTAVRVNQYNAFLWTLGFVPRLAAYQGFETPKPLSVEVTHGAADLEQVLADVLSLTKINYNSCDFSAGLPVTLKFADRVGDILMAAPPPERAEPPLPFRFYT